MIYARAGQGKNTRDAMVDKTMTNKERSKKAIEFSLNYERSRGKNPEDVSMNKKHLGYDIKSEEKFIEVKGIGESWETYNWQSLYKTERECLRKNPNNFYLYIVKYENKKSDKVEGFYIIPGAELESKFRIEIETFGIRPISKSSLEEFLR